MSTRPAASPDDQPARRLHLVGAAIAAIAAIAALAAVNSAAVGATTPDSQNAAPESRSAHRTALAQVDPQAIASLTHHAPDLADSEWCHAMEIHDGDWDGFASKVTTAADNWSNTEAGMFEFVGLVVQTVCPETAASFVASTQR